MHTVTRACIALKFRDRSPQAVFDLRFLGTFFWPVTVALWMHGSCVDNCMRGLQSRAAARSLEYSLSDGSVISKSIRTSEAKF